MIYQTESLASSDQLLLLGMESIHTTSLLQLTHEIFKSWNLVQIAYKIESKNHNITKSESFNSLHYLLHLFYTFFACNQELHEGMARINEFLTLSNIPEYFQNSDMLLSFNECLKLMLLSFTYV